MSRYVLVLPGLILGLLGGLFLLFRPLVLTSASFGVHVFTTLALISVLAGSAWLLNKFVRSFRYATQLIERVFLRVRLDPVSVVMLAVISSVGEEVFFRGALQSLIGVWGQALVFGLLHPATKKGWSYTVYTFFAGLCFGYAVMITGALWAGMIAHFVINLHGFLEAYALQRARDKARAARMAVSHQLRAARQSDASTPN